MPLHDLTRKEASGMMNTASFSSAVAAFAAGKDPNLAANASNDAVENNSLIGMGNFSLQVQQFEAEDKLKSLEDQAKKKDLTAEERMALGKEIRTQRKKVKNLGIYISAERKAQHEAVLLTVEVADKLSDAAGIATGGTTTVAKQAIKKGVKTVVKEAKKQLTKAAGKKAAKNKKGKVIWKDENASMQPKAKLYNDSAHGARSNVITKKGQAPGLSFTNKDGSKKIVRFDGFDGKVLIDRKRSVFTSKKTENQALRQSRALKENGLKGRWEVPSNSEAKRARKLLDKLDIKNIDIKVVPE